MLEFVLMTGSTQQILQKRISEARETFAQLGEHFCKILEESAEACIASLKNGGAIYFVGNGGSAADAQHWAAELVGRYLQERIPINAHALTVNSSTYTALVNDYPPSEVFERQVLAHVKAGDVLVAISTSGQSENILLAVAAAQKIGASVIAVTGKDGGELAKMSELVFVAPSFDTPRIQEAHLFFGHCLCELIESAFIRE
jgi:D-sedoheptulose 7-phosphate isomerase